MASDGNGCTDFPSQQKSFVKLADISMLCNNMTRWPLTHLCSPKQLCPKNLCATNVAFVGLPLFALSFWNIALWNLFGCLDGNGCTDFPSQQKSCVKLADISMLCDNMTRWPLTHLCSPKQLCPKNLCATKMFLLCKVLKFVWKLVSRKFFSWGTTCTRRPNAAELRWACWTFHAVPEYVTHLALTRLCVLSRGVPRSFVLQVLVMQFEISSPAWQCKYHLLNVQICTMSQVNRVVLSSLLTRHAVLEDLTLTRDLSQDP